jgi:ubiquitin C-terminal hydrolase
MTALVVFTQPSVNLLDNGPSHEEEETVNDGLPENGSLSDGIIVKAVPMIAGPIVVDPVSTDEPSLASEDDDNDKFMDAAMDEVLEQEDEEDKKMEERIDSTGRQSAAASVSLGGLSNLGNTCYMAAALQMLASLDEFVASVQANEPFRDSAETRELRQAFLDVVQQLKAGKTVRPEAFKEVMDERSPLFVGFRQQDSHEFLTTLLDMLDEDYKRKVEEEKEEEEEGDAGSSQVADEQDQSELSTVCSPVASKKPRTEAFEDEAPSMELEEVGSAQESPSGSFSELDVDAIGRLLHGTGASRESLVLPVTTIPPASPTIATGSYRLIGGRMTPTDVVLTPYYSEYSKLKAQTLEPASPARSTTSMADASVETEENMDVETTETSFSSTEEPFSPVSSYFTTEVRVRLTCNSCRYTRTHVERFLHLSLEIGPDTSSVEDGLRRFFAPENREIKCEKCFCETATQTMEIIKLPSALLLHFKRFIVDVSPDYTSVTYRKNQSAVLFDEELSLNEDLGVLLEFLALDCSSPCSRGRSGPAKKYSLRSVVNHIGSSASCGHYTTDAKRLYSSEREWTRFNDSYVTRISSKEAIEGSRKTAYMVLYELE